MTAGSFSLEHRGTNAISWLAASNQTWLTWGDATSPPDAGHYDWQTETLVYLQVRIGILFIGFFATQTRDAEVL